MSNRTSTIVSAAFAALIAIWFAVEYRNSNDAAARPERSILPPETLPFSGPKLDPENRASAIARTTGTSEWAKLRGFTAEYNMHFTNREFLEEQAANGDMLAAQMLGYQMLGSAQGNALLTDAATLGSIQALHFLSWSSQLVAEGSLKEQRENQQSSYDQHDFAVRALEYLFVAEIRGDNYIAPHSVIDLMARFSYTDEDVEQACHQARARYAALQKARAAAGRPEFDNGCAPGGSAISEFAKLCPE